MSSFILVKKLGMTTIFNDGVAKNVTLFEAGKNLVTQIRTMEKDGYSAVQVGLLKKDAEGKERRDFVKFKELKLEKIEQKVGDEMTLDQFAVGDKVELIGISKGKGYQGVMKRHGFSGSPATHGHRHDHRAPGSIGCAFPERVFKGKRMAGRMGSNQVTCKNRKIILIDKEKRLIAIMGAAPGNNGSIVQIVKK